MPTVTFYRTTADGQQEAGTATLRAGRVVFDGVDPRVVEGLQTEGVRLGSQVFRVKDGISFLQVLPVQFRGSMLRARYEA